MVPRTTSLILLVCFSVVLTFSSPGYAAEDYSDWSYSQRIFLNTSSTGANVSGSVYSVPVLIILKPNNFRYFSQTADGGRDIRFSKSDGTHIPYEIERWTAGDTAFIWVLIDTVRASNHAQSIVMHWGNEEAADSSNQAAVFRSDQDFLGAWHLNGNLYDATGNEDNTGIDSGTTDYPEGIIAHARSFDGVNDFISLGDLPNRPRGTVSCWFRLAERFTAIDTTRGIWSKKYNDSYNTHMGLRGIDFICDPNTSIACRGSSGSLQTKMEFNNAGTYLADIATSYDSARWYHVAWSWGDTHVVMYVNGVLRDERDSSFTVGDSIGSADDILGYGLYDVYNLTDSKRRYFKGAIDEFRMETTVRPEAWIKLNYENQRPGQKLVRSSGVLTWDSSTASNVQSGSGIWGDNSHWCDTAMSTTQLYPWPGRGYSALFRGFSSGDYTVTVSGTRTVDSMAIRSARYAFEGGTIDLGTNSGISNSSNVTIGSLIAGSGGLTKYGNGILTLTGDNIYTGPTRITSGTLSAASIKNGGSACALGASGAGASNLVILGGTLAYTGAAASSDRLFTIGTGGAILEASGTGALDLTGAGLVGIEGEGDRTLTLGGTNTGDNTLAAAVRDSGGTTSLTKGGEGTWVLTGANTFTGPTSITDGTLIVNGSLAAGSAVTVSAGATLGGSGAVNGPVDAAAGALSPGSGGPGGLRTGALTLGAASVVNLDLGTVSDTIAVAGDLLLDGTINIAAAPGFTEGSYRIFTFSGELTDSTIEAGTMPPGMNCVIDLGEGFVTATFTKGLIESGPEDTTVIIGKNAGFSVTANPGSGTLTYAWQRYPSDSVIGTGSAFELMETTVSDNNARLRCIVSDSLGPDTSRWAVLTVIDTPRVMQMLPEGAVTVPMGGEITFSVAVLDTMNCVYEWRKEGVETPLGTKSSLFISDLQIENEGNYYCILTSSAATVSSDIVRLTVIAPAPDASFGIEPAGGTVPLEVYFTDSSSGIITSRRWTFGDGGTDTVSNPRHTYESAGTFTAKLVVQGPGGKDSTTRQVAVENSDGGENPLRITGLEFDSALASIRIAWCVDPDKYDGDLDVGIAYRLGGFPASRDIKQTVVLLETCTDTAVRLFEPLQFDTVYYVSVFVRKPSGPWSAASDSSRDSVRVGSFFREVVTYFDDESGDTVKAFEGNVILRKEGGNDQVEFTDTLEIHRIEPPEGLTAAGVPFRFVRGQSGPDIVVGLRVDALPSGASISDVRIYRESGGKLFVEYASFPDTAEKIVYVKTSDLKPPFIPMVDARGPEVRILTDIDTCAYPQSDLVDSVTIRDNIANVRWTYYYGRGDEPPVARDSGELDDTEGTQMLVISKSSQVISSDYGMRAMLVVSDGVHSDTLILSRPVRRQDSDPSTTDRGIWTPLYPTARLDRTDPDSLIISMVKDAGGKYDTRHMRLYRWIGNGGEQDWVEYDPLDDRKRQLFSVVPGRLMWLKTRKNTPLSFGPGYTLSLRDTFVMEIPAGQFTDFGMPYRFGVKLRDIFASSGEAARDIQFYSWERDSVTGRYRCAPHFIATISDHSSDGSVLEYRTRGGYSLYNPGEKAVILRIPPTLATMEEPGAAAKRKGDRSKSWGARFMATSGNGFRFAPVYCGYSPGTLTERYPVPPGFDAVTFYLLDRSSGKKQGNFIADRAAAGLAEELCLSNISDTAETISFRFETAGAFPETFGARLYDNLSGRFSHEGEITVAPRSTVSRWVVVGDESYRSRFSKSIRAFRYGLQRIYPNPARSVVNIRYSVPAGAQERLRITIFDLRGRKVWERRVDGALVHGYHVTTWDGKDRSGNRVGAGRYPIRLTVENPEGKTIKRFEECVTYLP